MQCEWQETAQCGDVKHSLLLILRISTSENQGQGAPQCHTRISGLADVREAEVQSDTTSGEG